MLGRGALFLVVTVGSVIGLERSNAQFAKGLVNSLVNAEPSRVKDYVDQIEDYRWWTEPLLEARYAAARDAFTSSVHDAERSKARAALDIDAPRCPKRNGRMRVIVCLGDCRGQVVKAILDALGLEDA